MNLSLNLKAEAHPKEPLASERKANTPHLAPASPASYHTAPIILGDPHRPCESFLCPCVFPQDSVFLLSKCLVGPQRKKAYTSIIGAIYSSKESRA